MVYALFENPPLISELAAVAAPGTASLVTSTVSSTGTVLTPTGQPVQNTQSKNNRLRNEGKWQAGRVDRTTGAPIGGSAHWQAWIRGGAKTYRG